MQGGNVCMWGVHIRSLTAPHAQRGRGATGFRSFHPFPGAYPIHCNTFQADKGANGYRKQAPASTGPGPCGRAGRDYWLTGDGFWSAAAEPPAPFRVGVLVGPPTRACTMSGWVQLVEVCRSVQIALHQDKPNRSREGVSPPGLATIVPWERQPTVNARTNSAVYINI